MNNQYVELDGTVDVDPDQLYQVLTPDGNETVHRGKDLVGMVGSVYVRIPLHKVEVGETEWRELLPNELPELGDEISADGVRWIKPRLGFTAPKKAGMYYRRRVKPEAKANDAQISGDHYKSKAIQPWDYITSNNMGYLEGNVVKYVSRYKEKNGIEDLRKAEHYLCKLIEVTENE